MSVIAATIATGVLTRVAGESVLGLRDKVRRGVVGDSETKAFAAALTAAHDSTRAQFATIWATYDVNLECFQGEGEDELAVVLLGRTPSEHRLAAAIVDALTPNLELDERWTRIETLRESCRVFVAALRDGLAAHDAFRTALPPAMSDHRDERDEYLRWVTQQFRYVETTGIGTTGSLSLPLSDIFVTVRASDRDLGGKLADGALKEKARLEELGRTGAATAEEVEAAIDRLHLREGDRARAPETDESLAEPLDVVRVIDESPRLVVIGDPGSGKTTVLRFLALQHGRALLGDGRAAEIVGRPRLPIFVSIAEYMASGASGLRAYLASAPAEHGYANTPPLALFDRALRDGEVLVLLDGLDEVGRADRRSRSTRAITSLSNSLDEARASIVVTTRPAGYDAAPLSDRFRHVEVSDMDGDAISSFLDGYLPAAIGAAAEHKDPAMVAQEAAAAKAAMAGAIAASPGIRRLAVNPLLLTAMVLVHRSSGGLPASRIEAYQQIDTALTETWRRQAGVGDDARPNADEVRRWLRSLARWMHEHRPERSASGRDLVEVWGQRWCERSGVAWTDDLLDVGDLMGSEVGRGVMAFVEDIAVHTGLLVERAPGRWGFPHLTFQEYYVALSLMQDVWRRERPSTIRSVLHHPDYEEAVLLALGMMARVQESEGDRWEAFEATVLGIAPVGDTETLAPTPLEDVLGRDVLFALRALADDLDLPRVEVGRLIDGVFAELSSRTGRGRYSAFRRAVTTRLSRLGPTRHGRALSEVVDRWADDLDADQVIDLAGGGLGSTRLLARVEALAGGPDGERAVQSAVRAIEGWSSPTVEVFEALERIVGTAQGDAPRQAAMRGLLALSLRHEPARAAARRLVMAPDTDQAHLIESANGAQGDESVEAALVVRLAEAAGRGPEDDPIAKKAVLALALRMDRDDARAAVNQILDAARTDLRLVGRMLQALSVWDAGEETARFARQLLDEHSVTELAERNVLPAIARTLAPYALEDDGLASTLDRLVREPALDLSMRNVMIRGIGGGGYWSVAVDEGWSEVLTGMGPERVLPSRPPQPALLGMATVRTLETIALAPTSSPEVVSAAIEALGSSTLGPDDAAGSALHRIVAESEAHATRLVQALYALGEQGRPSTVAVDRAVEIARRTQIGTDLADQALHALARLTRCQAAVESLGRLASDRAVSPLRLGAMPLGVVPPSVRHETIARLRTLLLDPGTPVVQAAAAIEALADAGDADLAHVAALLAFIEDPDRDTELVVGAVDWIRLLAPPATAVSAMRKLLAAREGEAAVAAAAVWALARLADDGCLDASTELVGLYGSAAGRRAVEWAVLGQRSDDPDWGWAPGGIVDATGEWPVRRRLIEQLGLFLDLSVLRLALVDPDNDVRRGAAWALARRARADLTFAGELVGWLHEPGLDVTDYYLDRPAWEYLYDALAAALGGADAPGA